MADLPRFYLITPPLAADAAAFAPVLEAALAAADVACVLIRAADPDPHRLKELARLLVPMIQIRGAAALIEGDARLAVRLDVDGAHVANADDSLTDALATLQPSRIVGVGPIAERDAAMRAGEMGVDYLMFGWPGTGDTDTEAVGWWARIFNVPCVAYAAHPGAALALAAQGPEFVALCEGLWDAAEPADHILRKLQGDFARLAEEVAS